MRDDPKAPTVEQPAQQGLTFERHENFESWYANNVQFQASEWDLKFIFGELDQSGGKPTVIQHTSIVQSWLQAKIMHYFFTLQLGAFEMLHGKIPVPPSVMPPEPTPPDGDLKDDPAAQQIYEYIKKVREVFLAQQSQ